MIPRRTSQFAPGKLQSAFDEVWAAIESMRLVESPDVKFSRRPSGTSLEVISSAGPGIEIKMMQVLYEGPDALKCKDINGAIYYVAKPQDLMAISAVNHLASAANYPLHDPQVRMTDRAVSLNAWPVPYTPFGEFIRSTTINDGVNPPWTVHEVIDPPYDWAEAAQNITGYKQFILAAKVQGGVGYLDPGSESAATLFIDTATMASGGSTQVNWLDLNIDARRWRKLSEANSTEQVNPNSLVNAGYATPSHPVVVREP